MKLRDMRFEWLLALLFVLGCHARTPNVPQECMVGNAETPRCTRAYKRIRRVFHSKPRWGIWSRPFRYFHLLDPGHGSYVERARSYLARWGNPEAGRHAAAELSEIRASTYKRRALEDLFTLGPVAREWIPEVRAFHRRHAAERWGLDVLTLARMGAPEGTELLRAGLRSSANPGAYLRGTIEMYRGLESELTHLHQNDPRYAVRSDAGAILRALAPDTLQIGKTKRPLPCISDYEDKGTSIVVGWGDSELAFAPFRFRDLTGAACAHAPSEDKVAARHFEIMGECALAYGDGFIPERFAVYPRDRDPYTLFEDRNAATTLEWNDSYWVVSLHTHWMPQTGGMIRVIRDHEGYLRVSNYIDVGGQPLGYREEKDGSLLILVDAGSGLYARLCGGGGHGDLELVRLRRDLQVTAGSETLGRIESAKGSANVFQLSP